VKKRETLLLRRLKAGRGGKVVTEISGFQAAPAQIQELLKRLQSRLGTGGTAKGKLIELQGECRGRVKPLLEDEGYGVKGI
jgi:translation initiation factor 1